MTKVLDSEVENEDSLESFCAQYARRVLEIMDRDICKTASALDVDGCRLSSLVAQCNN